MAKREKLLGLITLAVAEGDEKTAIRIYTENRISYESFNRACQKGDELKERLNGRKVSETLIKDL